MAKVLITRKIPSIAEQMLSKHFQVDVNTKERPLTKEELKEAVKEYDGMLSLMMDSLDEEVLNCSKNLKVIANYATGLDNIDLQAAQKRDIKAFNLVDLVTNSTADHSVALFLTLIRKIIPASRYVLEGKWKSVDPLFFLGEELWGKTYGMIGFGKIGKEVAKRLLPFGVNILFYHYRTLSLEENLQKAQQVPLQELYEKSDYLSLHVPLTEKTRYMIDLAAMKQMKKKPILINMARGAVVNTDDLLQALEEGIIRGAALDVTDPEPLPYPHPLYEKENCLIVPHIGTATVECRTESAKRCAELLIEHLK